MHVYKELRFRLRHQYPEVEWLILKGELALFGESTLVVAILPAFLYSDQGGHVSDKLIIHPE
ncbi:hypothetical protein KSD_02550 [Ktedonobacter sp. SOSP1-85]|nr:hypothetical protein KSD_02550 [Ktedonobacter sp. SOSP1-85]